MDQRVSRAGRRGEEGFTVVEVMIAMLVLVIGLAGILSLQLTAIRATSFSRHATEASLLAEDKMEALRTVPAATLVAGTDTVNAGGMVDAEGLYTREWTITAGGATTAVTVAVTWSEQGSEPYTITMSTLRTP